MSEQATAAVGRSQEPVRLGLILEDEAGVERVLASARDIAGLTIVGAVYGGSSGPSVSQIGQLGCLPRFDSPDTLMRDPTIDAIYVAAAVSAREDCAVASLELGKHVLCEAPVADNAEQARYMLRASRSFQRVFREVGGGSLGSALEQAQELVRSGDLGALRTVRGRLGWPGSNSPDAATRALSMLVRCTTGLVGAEGAITRAQMATSADQAPAGGAVCLQFANGAQADLQFGAAAGEADWLRLEFDGGEIAIGNFNGGRAGPVTVAVTPYGGETARSEYQHDSLRGELEDFVNAIRQPWTDPGEAPLRHLQLLDAIRAAAEAATDRGVHIAGFRLAEADLHGRTWAFGQKGAPPFSRHVKLLPGGRLGGHSVETEQRWALEDGVLTLFDRLDRRSTVFTDAFVEPDGRLSLYGPFRLLPGSPVIHALREVPSPSRICPTEEGVPALCGPTRRRRNLLILRANEQSLHTSWLRDIQDADRNWDLCISWYGAEAAFPAGGAEWTTLQRAERKYPALYRLLHADSPLWAYDYIGAFDDDLQLNWSDLNQLFAICHQFRLELAQPSLAPESHNIYPLLRTQPDYVLRYTSFVECMAPVFSRDALRACVPTFGEAPRGSGLDNVWPKLIGEPRDGIAVIDRASIIHTRPTGAGYSLARSVAEGNQLQRKYGAASILEEYGGVYDSPRRPA